MNQGPLQEQVLLTTEPPLQPLNYLYLRDSSVKIILATCYIEHYLHLQLVMFCISFEIKGYIENTI